MDKKSAKGRVGCPLTLLAAACIAMVSSGVRAQPTIASISSNPCADIRPDDAQDLVLLSKLMLEPRKFSNLADLLKTLPPEAMAKMATMQKTAAERQTKDWPNLCRYAADNAQVIASGVRPQTIFLGDSITENWKLGDPALFGAEVLDRGIGGQTTPQILLRFYQDVVALRPRVVHIMAGVNDIMANTGPTSDATIINNIRAMIDIAKANGIHVVLAMITPSKTFVARPDINMVPRIATINRQISQLAKERRVAIVDYGLVLADSEGGLKDALGNDGLHPNRDGYAIMRPLTDAAIARARH